MAYRCVHCSSIFKDNAPEIYEGCSSCKSKFFFYIKEEKLKEILGNKKAPSGEDELKLSSSDKKQIEKDVREIVGVKDEDVPVFLDFESIKVLKPGKYMLDLQKLFASDKPRVYQLEDGKYVVDLTNIMRDASLKKKNK